MKYQVVVYRKDGKPFVSKPYNTLEEADEKMWYLLFGKFHDTPERVRMYINQMMR